MIRDKATGAESTLLQLLERLSITAHDMSINTLDMHADMSTMHRFDRFNLKYNPVNSGDLREVFLKTENFMGGEYFAQITKQVHAELVEDKYQMAENRVSIYGKSRDEWKKMAAWLVRKVGYTSHIRWMIQVPRLYSTYANLPNFAALLANFFLPLFEVTVDPSVDPDLHRLLGWISGIDLVDDESKQDVPLPLNADTPAPEAWAGAAEPPYAYWCYYFSSNLAALNRLRLERGLTQFSFRPHCGEAGDPNHLVAAFLTAEHINHGINLRPVPSLEYLYYLAQIGLAMSPLSNKCVAGAARGPPRPAKFSPPPPFPPLFLRARAQQALLRV